MKHVILRLLLVLSVISSLCLQTASANTALDMDSINSQVDKYFKSSSAVGGSLVIAKDGQIVYSRDYGFAIKSKQTPVTEKTYFRIASVTKMVSAIGIMQLNEQGMLDLDEDISRYFGYGIVNPYYPDIPITLRQSMSHTTSLSQGGGYSSIRNTIHDMLSSEVRHRSNFTKKQPGEAYSYSNFGAGLMGSIMEAVSGVSVNRYMTEHVFEPLDIDAAYAACFLKEPEYIASVYENGQLSKSASKYIAEAYDDTADPERHYRITVGDLFIRSRDMAKLVSLLCGDGSYQGARILKPESVEMMRMDQRDVNASVTGKSPYGLGVNRMENLLDGHWLYGHQGMAIGLICNAYYDPETGFTFVLFTNGCSQVRQDRISILARRLFEYTYPLFAQE